MLLYANYGTTGGSIMLRIVSGLEAGGIHTVITPIACSFEYSNCVADCIAKSMVGGDLSSCLQQCKQDVIACYQKYLQQLNDEYWSTYHDITAIGRLINYQICMYKAYGAEITWKEGIDLCHSDNEYMEDINEIVSRYRPCGGKGYHHGWGGINDDCEGTAGPNPADKMRDRCKNEWGSISDNLKRYLYGWIDAIIGIELW